MAVRGVYNEEEKELLANVEKLKGKFVWAGEELTEEEHMPVTNHVVTRDTIRNFCNAIGDDNPLWRNEEYARNTRWGGIIAPPSFVSNIAASFGPGPIRMLFAAPRARGEYSPWNPGATYRFYKPVHVGDTFRVKDVICTSFEDKTRKDGRGPRQWLSAAERIYINQRDEEVCVVTRRDMHAILPPMVDGIAAANASQPKLPHYIYNKDEIDYIERAYDEWCQRRGAEPRYWEDVNVGDGLTPFITGPRTVWEQACAFMAMGGTLSRSIRISRKHFKSWLWRDPRTGIIHDGEEGHLEDLVAIGLWGAALCVTMGVQTDWELMFFITNWMGDDAFIKGFEARYRIYNPIEDVNFDKGKIVRKYIDKETGEHLVDIAVWPENIRGWIASPGKATVALPSRGGTGAQKELVVPVTTSFKPGDRVRVKSKPGWPGGYKMANSEGTVIEVDQPWGYVVIHLEKTDVAIDLGTTLAFRDDALEKI